MKPSLQFRQSQHLALTPQLQQSIKLLQLSTVELDQELERFLLENPLLERDESDYLVAKDVNGVEDDSSLPVIVNGDFYEGSSVGGNDPTDISPTQIAAGEDGDKDPGFDKAGSDYAEGIARNSSGGDDERSDNDTYGQAAEAALSLQQHLMQQLPLTSLSLRDRQFAAFVIAHLDDDGYLTCEMDDMVSLLQSNMSDDLSDMDFDTDNLRDELNIALQHIQHLDPTGVGARTLTECLNLQLEALPVTTPY
ncbi:MAG: RNA polymerase factor sigma-54, partial [Pseudomonadota bacterium]